MNTKTIEITEKFTPCNECTYGYIIIDGHPALCSCRKTYIKKIGLVFNLLLINRSVVEMGKEAENMMDGTMYPGKPEKARKSLIVFDQILLEKRNAIQELENFEKECNVVIISDKLHFGEN